MKNYHRSYVPGREEGEEEKKDTEGKKPNTKGVDVQVYLGTWLITPPSGVEIAVT